MTKQAPILFQTRVSAKLAAFIEREAKRADLSGAGWLRALIIRAYNQPPTDHRGPFAGAQGQIDALRERVEILERHVKSDWEGEPETRRKRGDWEGEPETRRKRGPL